MSDSQYTPRSDQGIGRETLNAATSAPDRSRKQHLYKSRRYKAAAEQARERSDNTCQGCGMAPAESCHHWAWPAEAVPDRLSVTSDDLTALCWECHELIETFRRGRAAGVSAALLGLAFRAVVKVLISLQNDVDGKSAAEFMEAQNAK